MFLGLAVALGIVLTAVLPFVAFTPRALPIPRDCSSVDALDAFLQLLVDRETPPAVSVAVIKNGQVAYQKAFGAADVVPRPCAAPDGIYHFWSVTKLFTATAVMQLADEGKLSLDEPVTRYLPAFAVHGSSTGPAAITVRQLLNHTSGMKNLSLTHMLGWIHHLDDPPVSQSALVADRMGSYRLLARAPGQAGAYTNAGYIVLGAVIESAAGKCYEDVIRERILRPLAMNSTDFLYRDDLLPRAVSGTHPLFHFFTPLLVLLHRDWFSHWVNRVLRRRMWLAPIYTDYTGPTGLIGTAMDLARFGQAFVAGGELGGQRILSGETARSMLDEGYGANAGPDRDRMGVGWHWWSEAPIPFKGHGGEGPGFAAQLAVIPTHDLVIAILANDSLIDRVGLTNLIAAIFK